LKLFCTICGALAHDIQVPHQKMELSICETCLPFYNEQQTKIKEIERTIWKYHHLTGKLTDKYG
jgi:ribosome-binding protein aMBF1 (putative translation factor)